MYVTSKSFLIKSEGCCWWSLRDFRSVLSASWKSTQAANFPFMVPTWQRKSLPWGKKIRENQKILGLFCLFFKPRSIGLCSHRVSAFLACMKGDFAETGFCHQPCEFSENTCIVSALFSELCHYCSEKMLRVLSDSARWFIPVLFLVQLCEEITCAWHTGFSSDTQLLRCLCACAWMCVCECVCVILGLVWGSLWSSGCSGLKV